MGDKMTSQIAVMNSLGVAVASDTVSTSTFKERTKTINNHEKIWPFSGHNVCVLHSGNIYFNDVNMRLLVHEWMRSVTRPFDTLEEYAQNFFDWLESDQQIVSAESEKAVANRMLNDHYHEIKRRIEYSMYEPADFESLGESITHFVGQGRSWLEGLQPYERAELEHDQQFLNQADIDLDAKLEYIFEDIEGWQEFAQELSDQAPLVLNRSQEMPDDQVVAFVGFGLHDYFPKTVNVPLRGRYAGVNRGKVEDAFGASGGISSGSISTFAQAGSIWAFLRGYDYAFVREVRGFIWDSVHELLDGATDVAESARNTLKEFDAWLNRYSEENFQDPVLDHISSLSLKGLANLAESLVGMQATRSASSPGPASVGGVIGLLTIDRHEGLRWVRSLRDGVS